MTEKKTFNRPLLYGIGLNIKHINGLHRSDYLKDSGLIQCNDMDLMLMSKSIVDDISPNCSEETKLRIMETIREEGRCLHLLELYGISIDDEHNTVNDYVIELDSSFDLIFHKVNFNKLGAYKERFTHIIIINQNTSMARELRDCADRQSETFIQACRAVRKSSLVKRRIDEEASKDNVLHLGIENSLSEKDIEDLYQVNKECDKARTMVIASMEARAKCTYKLLHTALNKIELGDYKYACYCIEKDFPFISDTETERVRDAVTDKLIDLCHLRMFFDTLTDIRKLSYRKLTEYSNMADLLADQCAGTISVTESLIKELSNQEG